MRVMLATIRPRTFSVLYKHENGNIQDYNFAYCSVWVQNLVSNIKGGTLTKGV
jgi:hypothetical protein